MASEKSVGRTFGGLMLVQAALGYTVNFVLLGPVMADPPGYLMNAAAYPERVAMTALLMMATGALSLGITITAFPVFRRKSERMAVGYVAFGAANICLAAVEAASVMAMCRSASSSRNRAARTRALLRSPARS